MANEKLDISGVETLPIQADGRIQPIESFARNALKTLSGKSNLGDLSAAEWLMKSLFLPQEAVEIPVIFIGDQGVRRALHLPQRKGHLYRLDELNLAENMKDLPELLQKKAQKKVLTAQEKGLLDVFEKTALDTQILRSFTFDAAFYNGEAVENYTKLLPAMQDLEARVRAIIKTKGTDPSQYTEEEQRLVMTAASMTVIREGGEINTLFKVIPNSLDTDNQGWIAPWEIYTRGGGSPENGAFVDAWTKLRKDYVAGDASAFAASLHDLKALYAPFLEKDGLGAKLEIEALYMKLIPFGWAFGLYLASLLCALCAVLFKENRGAKYANILFKICFYTAVTVLVLAITARCYLLGRPPVGTLYESVLFASLIVGVGGALFDHMVGKHLYRLLAAFLGLFLLALSFFALPDQHGLNVLQAVLNTQFWLATHVLCVTIGYGLCLLAAALAHVNLAQQAFAKGNRLSVGLSEIRLSAGFALLFMSVGTALGGIWADQSWGRFWGWDPKENGALLIVLWLIWLLHGLISKDLKPLAFIFGVAVTGIFVALSWFGVNLLSIGLHSYGFIDGVAQGLGLYILLQCVILALLAHKIVRKNKNQQEIFG
ncbi:MAG: cytochrome c biogenesis protein [Pseudobdellovibrionaceae bacterium]